MFDIPGGVEEVLIPIDARVPVGEATLFAVRVEKPGGGGVSEKEHIVVMAK